MDKKTHTRREPTDEERAACPICADGWPVTTGPDNYAAHDMPEPFGMLRCKAGLMGVK